jgi:hypothetical protein
MDSYYHHHLMVERGNGRRPLFRAEDTSGERLRDREGAAPTGIYLQLQRTGLY